MEQKYGSGGSFNVGKFTKAEFRRFLGMVDTKNRFQLVRAAFGIAAINSHNRIGDVKNLTVKGMKLVFYTHFMIEMILHKFFVS